MQRDEQTFFFQVYLIVYLPAEPAGSHAAVFMVCIARKSISVWMIYYVIRLTNCLKCL